jgi:HAD superfamily hydrolase (TIGR01662 family)
MEIKAVLFDLGETLLNYGHLRPQILFNQAARLTYDYLRSLNQPIGSFSKYWMIHWAGLWWNLFRSWWRKRDFDSLATLRRYGEKEGYRLTENQWHDLESRWYRPLADQSHVESDLTETLKKLSDWGLKLGILSNSFVHSSALESHLNQLGILEFLTVRLFSYNFDYRKPDVRLFQEAIRQLGVHPQQVLFVGDRIAVDVRGSRAAGMIPVLKMAHTNAGKSLPSDLICIDRIAELPEILDRMHNVHRKE